MINVDDEVFAKLDQLLDEKASFDVADDRVHILMRILPDGFPAALMERDGELWIVMDPGQPLARWHAHALLREQTRRRPAPERSGQVVKIRLMPRPATLPARMFLAACGLIFTGLTGVAYGAGAVCDDDVIETAVYSP